MNSGPIKKTLSVCIPTYEMGGKGADFLRFSFSRLAAQSFKEFNIIISDHSIDNSIQKVCDEFAADLDIKYIRNSEKRGNSPANTNNAIKHADGKIIKILFQDDFLYNKNSLYTIVKNFNIKEDTWLVTACIQTRDGTTFYWPFYPRFNDKIHLGKNTISSPSVLAIKNENPLFFDEKLIWSMDCDYYKRYHDSYGDPKIINEICVVNRIGSHQISSTATDELMKEEEYAYILKKYNERWVWLRTSGKKIKRHLRYLKKSIASCFINKSQ